MSKKSKALRSSCSEIDEEGHEPILTPDDDDEAPVDPTEEPGMGEAGDDDDASEASPAAFLARAANGETFGPPTAEPPSRALLGRAGVAGIDEALEPPPRVLLLSRVGVAGNDEPPPRAAKLGEGSEEESEICLPFGPEEKE